MEEGADPSGRPDAEDEPAPPGQPGKLVNRPTNDLQRHEERAIAPRDDRWKRTGRGAVGKSKKARAAVTQYGCRRGAFFEGCEPRQEDGRADFRKEDAVSETQ